MKVETTQTEKRIIDVPVPSFYKGKYYSLDINHVRGILDEKTVVSVFESKRRTSVTNEDVDLAGSDIVKSFLEWQPITEDEFFVHYNRALHSMSLTPELSKQ